MIRDPKVGERKLKTKQIADWPYLIRSDGEMISMRTGRILRGGMSHGYRTVCLADGKRRILVRHHQMVMRWFVGLRPQGMVINHKNSIKTDNRLENLEYCTPKENSEHAKINRLYHSGSRCSFSKLTEEAIPLIQKAHQIGLSYNQLARAFRVSKKSITLIVAQKTWRYAIEDLKKKVRHPKTKPAGSVCER